MCVRSLGNIVGASIPCENMCVHLLDYIVGASPPLCVCSRSKNVCVRSLGCIVGASPPPVCLFKVSKYVCPFIGLNCGCVSPFENMFVRSLGYIVGA